MFENSFEEFDVSAYAFSVAVHPLFPFSSLIRRHALNHLFLLSSRRAVVQELIEEYAASEREDYAKWGQP